MPFPTPTIGKGQLAVILGCSPRTVQDKCASGEWPYTRPAGALRFTEEHVAFIIHLREKWPEEKPTSVETPQQATPPAPRPRGRHSATTEPTMTAHVNVVPLRSRLAPRLAEAP